MPILTAQERIGTEVGGRYRLKRILGEGGFSAVFEAEHALTSRAVALKLLHAHLVQTEQISQRFLLEAQSMAKIRHSGIVQVLDAGREADGTIFLALELLEGETLEATLGQAGPLTQPEAVQLAAEVLDALDAAHAREIVHRDIKPANIFLAREPDGTVRAKLLDFGIAHVMPKGGGKLTASGTILGTPEYMSPEQGRGGQVGPAADLWSTGIVLYEMLSGFVPWTSENSAAVLFSVAGDPLPDIRQFVPGLADGLVRVIERALEKKPEARYQSALEMRAALLAAARAAGIDTPAVRAEEARVARLAEPTPTPGPSPRPRINSTSSAAFPAQRPSLAPPARASSSSFPAVVPGGAREIDLEAPPAAEFVPEVAPAPRRTSSNREMSAVPGPDSTAARPRASSHHALPAAAPAPQHASSPLGVDAGIVDLPLPPPPARPAASSLAPPVERPRTLPPPSMLPGANPSAPRSPSPVTSGATGANPALALHPPPPANRRALLVGLPVAAVAVGAGLLFLLRARGAPDARAARSGDEAHEPAQDASPAEPPAAGAVRVLAPRFAIGVPFGLDEDGRRMFARHMTVSPSPRADGLRAVGTCARGTVYLYAGGDGLPLGSGAADVACDGFDVAVVPDVGGDGDDDVAAVTRNPEGVAFLDGHTMRPLRTVALPQARGVVAGLSVGGQPGVVVWVDSAEPGGATELVALGGRTGQVLWRTRGAGPLARLGNPSELGLAVGPDATGDGVPDVVAGATVSPALPAASVPERPRCVELFSGATGERAWTAPFCQLRGGSQSVSLGPDVNGDGRGDVAVGSDVARGADPHAVLVSGADASVIRRVVVPLGAAASGFGWPVYLGPDVSGDGVPDLAVGSVGSAGTHVTVVSGANGAAVASSAVGGAAGYPNLRVVITDGLLRGGAPAVLLADPTDGLHVDVLGAGS